MGAVGTCWDSGRTQVCQLEFQTCKGAISQARNPVGYVYSLDIYGRQNHYLLPSSPQID